MGIDVGFKGRTVSVEGLAVYTCQYILDLEPTGLNGKGTGGVKGE
jgi:hypothetical protein